MNPKLDAFLVLLIGGWVLFFALRFGFVGGSGVGAYRNKNPFNYWLGVGTTGVLVLVAAIALVLSSVGLIDLKP
jgi:hypothetical protein